MKKLQVFRSLMFVAFFALLSTAMSGCFYHSGYGYGGTYAYGRPYGVYGYARPYPRVYAAPPLRYSHRGYGYGGHGRRW